MASCIDRSHWKPYLDRPLPFVWLVIILSIALLTLALLATVAYRPYTSDDVSQQNAVASINIHSRPVIELPQNTYILKLPLYATSSVLPGGPEVKLLFTVLTLNVAGILLFLWAAWSFVSSYRLSSQSLLPVVWISGLGVSLGTVLVNPNSRNLEIGFAFAALAIMASWYKGTLDFTSSHRIVIPAIFIVLLGLLCYDDPYFGYTFVIPLIVVFGAKWLIYGKDARALALAIAMIAVLACAKVWWWLLWVIGIHSSQGSESFATLPSVTHNAQLLLAGTLTLFNANIFGQPILSLHSLAIEANFLILLVLTLLPLVFLPLSAIRRDIWKVFLILQPMFLIIAFLVNSDVVDISSDRYLVLLPFFGAVNLAIIVFSSISSRCRSLLNAFLALSIFLNFVTATQTYASSGGSSPNTANQQIAYIAEAHHLTKGYASYWNAGINQYFASNKVLFIQSGCSPENGVSVDHYLLNDQALTRHATNSFYLFDPTATRCTKADLARFFGKPQSIISLPGQQLVFLYDYDISSKMRTN